MLYPLSYEGRPVARATTSLGPRDFGVTVDQKAATPLGVPLPVGPS
jgi:hypothetical protein